MDKTNPETPLDSAAVLHKIKNGEVKVGKKSIIQSEGKAHQKEDKKIVIPEKTYEALEKKAKAEGKTPDEKAAEIVEAKAKAKTESSVFPADAKINDYGFLGFKKSWLEDLGWKKGMALKIEKNADGSITLRKA